MAEGINLQAHTLLKEALGPKKGDSRAEELKLATQLTGPSQRQRTLRHLPVFPWPVPLPCSLRLGKKSQEICRLGYLKEEIKCYWQLVIKKK